MPSEVTFKAVGDWSRDMQVGLQGALAVSMDVMGRTGEQACKHALILMAQSARVMAKKAPARRPVMKQGGLEYVNTYTQKSKEPHRVYKFRFGANVRPEAKLDGTWDQARRIKNHGLAKRSWFWGLNKIRGPSSPRPPIAGASRFYSILSDKSCGYVKENRIMYIQPAMPAGWELSVQQRATSRIMAQAVLKMENRFRREADKRGRALVRPLASYFLRAA